MERFRVTITSDGLHTDLDDKSALIKLVRSSKNCSLPEAMLVVEACVNGEPIVLEVTCLDDVQRWGKRIERAGFILNIGAAEDVVIGIEWKHP
jgi:hypothetical protein